MASRLRTVGVRDDGAIGVRDNGGVGVAKLPSFRARHGIQSGMTGRCWDSEVVDSNRLIL